MSQPIIPLKEFDQEMAATRRLIERVPSDRAEWKPHPKSFAIGHLTQLIAWMPGWIAETRSRARQTPHNNPPAGRSCKPAAMVADLVTVQNVYWRYRRCRAVQKRVGVKTSMSKPVP